MMGRLDRRRRSHQRVAWRTICAVRVVVLTCVLAGGLGAMATSASAAGEPWWGITTNARPTILSSGEQATIVAQATNLGDAITTGAIVVRDKVPAGLKVQSVAFFTFGFERGKFDLSSFLSAFGGSCTTTPREAVCVYPGIGESFLESPNPIAAVRPFEHLEMAVKAEVESGAESGPNEVEVSGGAAATATKAAVVSVGNAPTSFGVQNYEVNPEEDGGTVDARAGSHPFQLTTSLALNIGAESGEPNFRNVTEPALPRNFEFELPAGLVGNAQALPQCSIADFQRIKATGFANFCPSDTAIGVASATADEPGNLGMVTLPVPVFNLVPERGEPARFGFTQAKVPVILDTGVRTGADYGVKVSVRNVSELATLLSSEVTLWGTPGDPLHDNARGWACVAGGALLETAENLCRPEAQTHPSPFLTLPTSCAGTLQTSAEAQSWPSKAAPAGLSATSATSVKDAAGQPLSLTGCNQLAFSPSIEAAPDTRQGSAPTGLKVNLRVPQEGEQNASGLASSTIKDIDVTLPEGMTLNPASAGGLEACSEAQTGFTGFGQFSSAPDVSVPTFTSTLPSPFCPTASKVGTAKITSPLLANPLEGGVYLATQNQNPFGSLVALYIIAEDPISGTLVKLTGEVSLNSSTGQIESTFKGNPQLPFEDAELIFFSGNKAALTTPSRCGSYTTRASFVPWSGGAAANSSSTFDISSSGPGGGCPSSLPFGPTLTAGTSVARAGAFSTLTTTISREDGSQALQNVQIHTPPGLSGILTGVALCDEAAANAGTCPSQSLIGHTSANVGVGGEPYKVTGGEVFLTEHYAGAPFGLSIVVPAVAGPFNLGKVVVRAKIEVDPLTAQLTVTTGAIPHILDGIPLQIRRVEVAIDRPGFTFNPTNCNPLTITGVAGGLEGASAPVSTGFQAKECASLKFAPKFAVSTAAKSSKAQGASLTAKLAYPAAPQGSQTNIARVKVDLPKQLPSRLTTLQKACLAKVFEANPASCPAESIVGHAVVHTPVLPVPLTGPAYFVSHGNEAFPNLTMVLQGYGVTVELVGITNIKKGITSNTFQSVPDVPFSTFELTLPQGKFSALAANLPESAKGSFCGQQLTMPTEFLAQNGAVIHQTTKVTASGCTKPKPLTRAQKLKQALKACAKKPKGKRPMCNQQARRKFAPEKKTKKAKKK
jgi:hypothetical protein